MIDVIVGGIAGFAVAFAVWAAWNPPYERALILMVAGTVLGLIAGALVKRRAG